MGQGAVHGLVLMSAMALFTVVSAEIEIRGCDSDKTVVEGQYQSFQCNGNDVPTSTFHWTLVTESGSTLPLATCYGRYNCSLTPVAQTTFLELSAYQYSHYNCWLYARPISQGFSGRLICNQTWDNSMVQSASCGINIVRIKTSGSCDIQEDRSGSCSCYTASVSPSTVTWSLATDAGPTLHLATCHDVSSCVTSPHVNITVTRYSSYSYVSFTFIHRDKSGQLTCSFTYQGVTETDRQQLNIYHPATVDNCGVGVSARNWSLLLSCDVTHVFSSRGQYQFRIQRRFQLMQTSEVTQDSLDLITDFKPFGDALTAYINSSNSREYYSGRLFHSWPLSPAPGRYTFYTVYVSPGTTARSTTQRAYGVITVNPPAEPTLHNCGGVSCARDMNHAPCVCSTSHMGTPAGRLLWLLGDTVLAAGDYGVNVLELPHNSVSTTRGWEMVTCQLDWVTPLTVSVMVETKCPSETNTNNGGASPSATDQLLFSLTTDDQHNPATWIAVGAGAVLAVDIVVVVVVVIIMYRRGRLSACRCGDPVYDSPKPKRGDSSHDPDQHLYDVADTAVRQPAARLSNPVYENTAMETDERHM